MDYLLDDLVEYTMEKMAFAPPPYDPSKQKSVHLLNQNAIMKIEH